MTRRLLRQSTTSAASSCDLYPIVCRNCMKMKPCQRRSSLPSSTRRSRLRPLRGRGGRLTSVVAPDDGGWQPNASILIVGIRCTGKTTLAILASAPLGFGVIDADQHFHQITGLSGAAYITKHGFEKYRERELGLMRRLLDEHPTGRIIVGGPCLAESISRPLLKNSMMHFPIILVIRDLKDVSHCLGMHNTAKISQLAELTSSRYRSLSHFEFYNLSESPSALTADVPHQHRFLALKQVEDDFIHLLHSIQSQDPYPRTLQAHHSLAFLAPEAKSYSYALMLPIATISEIESKLPETDLAVDAVQIIVNLESCLRGGAHLDQTSATYITRQYYILRRHVKVPIIFHVELNLPPSQSPTNVSADVWPRYVEVVSHILRLAPEYITLDLNCGHEFAHEVLSRTGSTKVIGHFFDPTLDVAAWESADRLDLIRKAEQWHCDLVRICQQCRRTEDNSAVQHFLFRVKASGLNRIPIIAYNLGRSGRGSCFINSILTPVTHDIIKVASRSGLGNSGGDNDDNDGCMLTVQEAQRALYASFTLDRLRFGVFGSAGSTSLAPLMHNSAFEFYGMPHEFGIFPAASLHDIEATARDPGFGGATVRFPFKQEIVSIVDYLSPEAQAIGAVNTIVPLQQRSLESLVSDRNRVGPVEALFGDNTDWIGIYMSVRRNLSPVNIIKNNMTVLVIGAGGMARAAIYAALRLKVDHIFVQNRTLTNAEKLAQQFDGKKFPLFDVDLARANSVRVSSTRHQTATTNSPFRPWAGPARVNVIQSLTEPWPSGIDPPTIIISCIPGFTKNGPVLPDITVPETWLTSPTGGVVIDLAYNLTDTPLLRQIHSLQKRGWSTVNGLQVLPEQGFAQFELFTGRKAPRHLMRSKLERHIRAQD